MSTHLDDFIDRHRDEFDDAPPPPEVWDRINAGIKKDTTPPVIPMAGPGIVRSLSPRRWMVAAAAILVVALGTWIWFASHPGVAPSGTEVARQPVTNPGTASGKDSVAKTIDTTATVAPQMAVTAPANHRPESGLKTDPEPATAADAQAEEMYHYTRLIELKHQELKSLQKDEPLLYKKFAGDVNKLDSVYQNLKTQLPDDSNREQVLEAMIANLQLQIGLLNKQLDIIKQIKHSKKKAYEKAYQSV